MFLIQRLAAAGFFLALGNAVLAGGCGAKSGLRDHDAGSDASTVQACDNNDDCDNGNACDSHTCVEGTCQLLSEVNCDDQDPCTEEACEPTSGQCLVRALTLDLDGDGHKGPRPGFAPGTPGACGDDCNDASALAFPGNPEVCDGVDNDCDGVVDNNAQYVPAGAGAVRLSDAASLQANRGGLAFNGKLYAAAYAAQKSAWRTYVKGLTPSGTTAFGQEPVTNIPSDTFTGPIVWTGAEFGTTWEDRRDNNYEIYFNRLNKDGKKLGPDVRITIAPGFSLHPHLIWNGVEYILVWDDRRNGLNQNRLYGQRIGVDGKLIGGNIELSPAGQNAESPWIAEGTKGLGIAFTVGNAINKGVRFRTTAPDLSSPGPIKTIGTPGGVSPTVIFNDGRYVVTYGKRDAKPGNAIWGVVLDENGNQVVAEKRLTFGASFARTQAMLPLGDRLLLIWADDKDGNYEIYSKLLKTDLSELTARKRVTNNAAHSTSPLAAFGPSGDVGIVFDDQRSGSFQPYFTRLVCSAGSP